MNTANIEVKISPRAEWKQMFREAWRVERDFFYDPGSPRPRTCGTPRSATQPFIEGIGSRGGSQLPLRGDARATSSSAISASAAATAGRQARADRLARRATTRSKTAATVSRASTTARTGTRRLRAPLTQPGVNVVAGEYLLAVDGRNLTATDNVYSFFEATAGKQVQIRVGADPSGDRRPRR